MVSTTSKLAFAAALVAAAGIGGAIASKFAYSAGVIEGAVCLTVAHETYDENIANMNTSGLTIDAIDDQFKYDKKTCLAAAGDEGINTYTTRVRDSRPVSHPS